MSPWCNCNVCRVPTQVSDRTWRRHAPFRVPAPLAPPALDPQFGADFPLLDYPESDDDGDEDNGILDPAPAVEPQNFDDRQQVEEEEYREWPGVGDYALDNEGEDPYRMEWEDELQADEVCYFIRHCHTSDLFSTCRVTLRTTLTMTPWILVALLRSRSQRSCASHPRHLHQSMMFQTMRMIMFASRT